MNAKPTITAAEQNATAEQNAAAAPNEFILIKGQTQEGKKFRPSDWADRLIGAVAFYAREQFGQANEIADCVCVVNRNGIKGIVVNAKLDQLEPSLCNFMHSFANDNNLSIEKLNPNEWNNDHRRVVIKPKRQFI